MVSIPSWAHNRLRLHAKSIPRDYRGMPAVTRPQKITFGEMREAGVRGLLIYCSDYKCSHSIAINADQCPDDVRLSDLEARFVCKACGKRGADIRPDFHWNKPPVAATIVSVLVAPLRRTDQAARCVSLRLPTFRRRRPERPPTQRRAPPQSMTESN
jgi:hypothetical protein